MAERARTHTALAIRQTVQQRGAEATRNLREALHLPANLNDTSILGTAVAEVAARECQRNPEFAAEVRKIYDELLGLRGGSGARRGKRAEPLEPLVALRHTGKTVNPYAPPDPQELIYVYGVDKLGRALHEYTLDMLKQTADLIQAQHPGTKPTSRAKKDAVIAYIVQHSQE